jgi:hypothetical protein
MPSPDGWRISSLGQPQAKGRLHRLFPQFNAYICQYCHSPKCRHDHRLKQQPGWTVEQLADGTFRWTTPAGRSYDTEPTRYPV